MREPEKVSKIIPLSVLQVLRDKASETMLDSFLGCLLPPEP